MIKHSAEETRPQKELRERRGWGVRQYRGVGKNPLSIMGFALVVL